MQTVTVAGQKAIRRLLKGSMFTLEEHLKHLLRVKAFTKLGL